MPYLGNDWRSPGEIWLKTSGGWRTCKTITIRRTSMDQENQGTENSEQERKNDDDAPAKDRGFQWQTKASYIVLPGCPSRGPSFYFVSKRSSKQNDRYSTVGEAFQALQLRRSATDQRRFSYVCKLMELLIQNQHLSPEYGTAQKQVQATLTEIVKTVLDTECNIHVAKKIVNLSRQRHLEAKEQFVGKNLAFDRKLYELVDLLGKLKRFKVKKLKKGLSKHSMHITELPEECLRSIVSCLSDHRDISRLSRVNREFNKICNDSSIWKGLCKFHFSKQQLQKVNLGAYPNWKEMYRKFLRQGPMRDVYADILELCSHCHCMFWTGTSHPCTYDIEKANHRPPVFIPVTPEGFFHLFEN